MLTFPYAEQLQRDALQQKKKKSEWGNKMCQPKDTKHRNEYNKSVNLI